MSQSKTASYGSTYTTASDRTTVAFRGFSGTDKRILPTAARQKDTPQGLDEIVNLRVLPGGTLEKRCGFLPGAALSDGADASFSFRDSTGEHLFVLSGLHLYDVDTEDGSAISAGTLSAVGANPFFFSLRGKCYLHSGRTLYGYTPASGTFSALTGYAPLLGEGWQTDTEPGEIREYPNRLTRYLRIRYTCTGGNACTLRFPYLAGIALYVKHNGIAIPASRYALESGSRSVRVTETTAAGDTLELGLSLAGDEGGFAKLETVSASGVLYPERSDAKWILSCTDGVLLYDKRPSNTSIAESAVAFPQAGELYVPVNCTAEVPASDGEVCGMLPMGDALLLFANRAVHRLEQDGNGVKLTRTDRAFGCIGQGALTSVGSDPVTLSANGIFRLTESPNDAMGYRTVCLSESLAFPEFAAPANGKLMYSPRSDELCVCNPATGELSLLRLANGAWYTYRTDVAVPKIPIPTEGGVGFFSTDRVFCPSDAAYRDCGTDTALSPIHAWFATPWICFDAEGGTRRSAEFCLVADTVGDGVAYSLETDGDTVCGTLPSRLGAADTFPECLGCGVDPGRFRFLRAVLQTGGNGRALFHTLTLHAGA